ELLIILVRSLQGPRSACEHEVDWAKGKARRSDARNACWHFAICPLPLALNSSRSRPSSPDCESADAGCLDERRVASPLRCNYLWPAPALSELARASLA